MTEHGLTRAGMRSVGLACATRIHARVCPPLHLIPTRVNSHSVMVTYPTCENAITPWHKIIVGVIHEALPYELVKFFNVSHIIIFLTWWQHELFLLLLSFVIPIDEFLISV